MQVVNPSSLGIPASDTSGNEIPWSLWIKGNAVALDLLGNTQILGGTPNSLGYCAVPPYTFSLPPGLTEVSVLIDAVGGHVYGPSGETFPVASMTSTAALLTVSGPAFYAVPGLSPEPANLSSAIALLNAPNNSYYASYTPQLVDLASTVGLLDAPTNAYYASYTPEPAFLGVPTFFLGADQASAFATPGSIS
jgi:hypothetical protein